MKTKVHLIDGASLERIEELASSIDYRVPDWVPYTVAIEGTETSALDEAMVQTQHFSGLLRGCSNSLMLTEMIEDEDGEQHPLGQLLDDAAERLDQAHQEWLEVETGQQFYVQFVWSDVEPQMYGPFSTYEERDAKALELRTDDTEESGIYWVDSVEGKLTTGGFTNDFFDAVDNCDYCGAGPGEVHPSSCATLIERLADEEART